MRALKTAIVMLVAAALCVCTSALAQSDLEDVGKVKDYYADWLSSIPGVTNVGVGEGAGGAPEIELHADVITDQMRRLPHQLNGFPLRIIKDPRNPDDPAETYDAQAADDQGESSATKGSLAPMRENPASAPTTIAPSAPTAPTAPGPAVVVPPNL
ncbi:MAG: hypothetical protein WCA59_13895 [Candidatus Binataceae bacterium]